MPETCDCYKTLSNAQFHNKNLEKSPGILLKPPLSLNFEIDENYIIDVEVGVVVDDVHDGKCKDKLFLKMIMMIMTMILTMIIILMMILVMIMFMKFIIGIMVILI